MSDPSPAAPARFVSVALARPLQEPLTYAVPVGLDVRVGHVVLVPLGTRGETGYVVDCVAECDLPADRVRAVRRVLDPEPAFDERQLAFFRWIAKYYLAPLGMVVATALPSGLKAGTVRTLEATATGADALLNPLDQGPQIQVLREIASRAGLTLQGLTRRLADELDAEVVDRSVRRLVRDKHVRYAIREVHETRGTLVGLRLLAPPAAPRTPRQQSVVDLLAAAGGTMELASVVAALGPGARDAAARLARDGVIEKVDLPWRDPLDRVAPQADRAPPLNPAQAAARDALCAPDAAGPWLLFGVTGSGKTEVFLHVARHALAQDRQVLVLVPEIGLTPQLVGRFRARFGSAVAVLHSGLTGAERLAAWRRIRAGEARIAVGARSALFAPFRSLGLVVVDEEHDDSYKQDDGVRYHARDLAVVLGRDHGCPVVLASATPSIESWHNARRGVYRSLSLPLRATPRPVPVVEVVDLSALAPGDDGRRPLLAPEAVDALTTTFRDGGQAVVLYNRRGYATMVSCLSCGGTYACPSCGVSMTLHRGIRSLACHYCGLRRPYDGICPQCHKADMEEAGKGTERIEESLAAMFPDVPMARLDADTTTTRGAIATILEAFRAGRTQMLVGTQIIAKGHDFPGVQTAVIVSADHGFRLPDFRAAERTYALVVQTAGRAGRGSVPGRVIVQTWTPHHYALQHLADADAFLRAEARIRQTLAYPPFTRLCLVRLDGVERAAVQRTADALARTLRASVPAGSAIDVLGPAAAALPRLVGRWRVQLVLRGARTAPFRAWLEQRAADLAGASGKGVRVTIDVDPRDLL